MAGSDDKWVEVTVAIAADWFELAAAALNAIGANGVVLLGGDDGDPEFDRVPGPAHSAPAVRAYFPADDLIGERLSLLRARLAEAARECPVPVPAITLRQVDGADWAEAWKAYYHPIHLDRITIAPRWENYQAEPGEILIALDPGLAFGAGTHPTTQQCLLLLQSHLREGGRVADIGTGCGVLSLAAAELGAGEVVARDLDRVAVGVARANVAESGGGGRIKVEEGSLLDGLSGRFDLILANLVAPLVLEMLPELGGHLEQGGRAILAGIIGDRAAEVRAAVEECGLGIIEESRQGEWVALVVG